MEQITKAEEAFFKTVEPVGKRVIIKREFTSKGGIVLQGDHSKYKPKGVVVAVGPDATNIKVGDKVAWSSMTICEALNIEELKEEKTEGSYITTNEDYLAYKIK